MKRPSLHRLASTSGFSLVEVVLALGVATVGLVAIIGLFPQGLTSARNVIDDSIISLIVQDTIAYRRVYLQNNPAQIGTGDITFHMSEGAATNNAKFAMYKCEVVAKKLPSTYAPNLETTSVVVVWPWFRDSAAPNQQTLNTNIFLTEITVY